MRNDPNFIPIDGLTPDHDSSHILNIIQPSNKPPSSSLLQSKYINQEASEDGCLSYKAEVVSLFRSIAKRLATLSLIPKTRKTRELCL